MKRVGLPVIRLRYIALALYGLCSIWRIIFTLHHHKRKQKLWILEECAALLFFIRRGRDETTGVYYLEIQNVWDFPTRGFQNRIVQNNWWKQKDNILFIWNHICFPSPYLTLFGGLVTFRNHIARMQNVHKSFRWFHSPCQGGCWCIFLIELRVSII